jgi:8-oxo-dGTP pyrophosphatase MutT (NUDIX family)
MQIRNVVRIILLDPANRILLLKISPKGSMDPKNPITKPFWINPGGEIEPGESSKKAVLRELQEETGITKATVYEPAIWYGETILEKKDVPTLFKQEFFMVRVDAQAISMADMGEGERKLVDDVRWWTVREIQESDELFIPYCLRTYLESLLQALPAATKVIDLQPREKKNSHVS